MICLIDNYDSFTYNLVHYLIEVGAEVKVFRNDAIEISQIDDRFTGILMSPGPCTPNEAGICLELIQHFAGKLPMMGVCLGHQAIGQAFGAKVCRGDQPMHAKITDIHHQDVPFFKGIPNTFKATRYHSLIIEKESLPSHLQVIAESDDGVIQAIQHQEYPIYGVQFHPESIGSEYGHDLLKNFVTLCQEH